MNEFRIKTKTVYDNQKYILKYAVQKNIPYMLSHRWIDIKAYKDRKDAIKLLKILMEYDYQD